MPLGSERIFHEARQDISRRPQRRGRRIRRAVIMLGGFGVPGRAQHLIKALMEVGAKDLTCICNLCTFPIPGQYDVANLVERGQVRKIITTFPGNPTQSVPAVDLWRGAIWS